MRKKLLFIAPFAIVGIVLFTALGGVIVRELWNWLLPSLFSWPRINFWQALAMLALSRILFGGLGLHGSSESAFRRRMARWEAMSPEERERFRQGIRGRWGMGAASGESR